jgi:hypothetical protein
MSGRTHGIWEDFLTESLLFGRNQERSEITRGGITIDLANVALLDA